ncbi:MAG: anti-sigma-D factor RsdA [Pseudonocardiaceae bacterium]
MSGRDDEHGGYPFGNPFRRRHEADDPLGASNETPVDLAAVQADDALLDTLGSAGVGRGDADAELARVLMAWRRDVDTEAIGELVDTDTAVAVIRSARKPAPRRHPVLGPFAAAAAVLVIAFSGVGLAAKSAEPGDQLFSLTKVLYADYARSVEAAQTVETELAEADTAIKQGDTSRARESLERVQEQFPVIAEAQGRDDLATKRDELAERLQAMAPPAPPAPEENVTSTEPVPEVTPSSEAPVQPVPPSESPTSTLVTPPQQSTPPPDPSTPPSPSGVSAQPDPGTSQITPRASPPSDGSGSAPPELPPSS